MRASELGLTPARSPILIVEADLGLGAGIVEQLIADSHPAKLVQNVRHATLFAKRYPPSLAHRQPGRRPAGDRAR